MRVKYKFLLVVFLLERIYVFPFMVCVFSIKSLSSQMWEWSFNKRMQSSQGSTQLSEWSRVFFPAVEGVSLYGGALQTECCNNCHSVVGVCANSGNLNLHTLAHCSRLYKLFAVFFPAIYCTVNISNIKGVLYTFIISHTP